jgi:putative transposase
MLSIYEHLRSSHKGWIEEYLGGGSKIRQEEWMNRIAVASRPFIENMKALLGFRALGRDVIESGEGYPTPGGKCTL